MAIFLCVLCGKFVFRRSFVVYRLEHWSIRTLNLSLDFGHSAELSRSPRDGELVEPTCGEPVEGIRVWPNPKITPLYLLTVCRRAQFASAVAKWPGGRTRTVRRYFVRLWRIYQPMADTNSKFCKMLIVFLINQKDY